MQKPHSTGQRQGTTTLGRPEAHGDHSSPPIPSVLSELTTFLSLRPMATAKLLAQHVDDGRGYCRSCPIGAQSGRHIWPCTIYTAAARAARCHRS